MTFKGPADAEQFRVKHGRFGERFYFDPFPGDETWEPMGPDEEPYPSVSTIKKVTSRDFSPVAAKRVAEYAVDNIDKLAPLVKADPVGAIELLVGADRRGLNAAADRGTAVHTVMELLAKGIQPNMVNVDPSALPYVDACKAILHDLNPTFSYAEVVAVSRNYGYGGTFDAVIELDGKQYMVDWKSRKAGGHAAYIEEAWQVSAYAKADYWIVDYEGRAKRMKPPPLAGGLIFSICPGEDSYKVYPVDLDKGFDGFTRMLALWQAKNLPHFKPLGRPVELAPRTYRPSTMAPGPASEVKGTTADAGPAPETWDPFGELYEADARAEPTDEDPDDIVPPGIGDWVQVAWIETMNVGGKLHEMEQVLEGWLIGVDDAGTVVVADDNGNEQGVPGTRRPEIRPAVHPAPPGVVPIANPVDDAEVSPAAVVAPPPAPQPLRTSPISDGGGGGDPQIREWLRRRLAADVEALGGQSAVLRFWPKGVKPLDAAGTNQHSVADLDAIEKALDNLEADLRLPFGETKPGKPPEWLELVGKKVEVTWLEDGEPTWTLGIFKGWTEDGRIELGGDLDNGPVDPSRPDFMLKAWVEPSPAAVGLEEDMLAFAAEEDPDAHPDDVAATIARVMAFKEEFPRTYAMVEVRAKAEIPDMPNLKRPGVKVRHLTDLIKILWEETDALNVRVGQITTLQHEDPFIQIALTFATGAVTDDFKEPSEDLVLRLQVLTEGLASGKLVLNEGDDGSKSLEISEEGIAELRQVYPAVPKLYRAVNPILQRYGFNSINKLELLRRNPLALMALQEAETKTQD